MAGNWKMNVPSSDAKALVEEIVESINDIKNVDVLVCPPFTSIASKKGLNDSLRVMVSAQKFYPYILKFPQLCFMRLGHSCNCRA
jgi:triosephosphate isomerase